MPRLQSRRHPRLAQSVVSWTALVVAASACGESSSPTQPELPPEGPPAIELSSTSAAFSGVVGGPAPAAEMVSVANGGEGTLTGLAAAISYGAGQPTGWLSADLGGTTAPTTLTIEADGAGASPGTLDATVTVTGTGVTGSATVTVTLVTSEGEPPTIVITSPARASMLQVGTYADSDVQITGEACHATVPITVLSVNGTPVPVPGTNLCEPFDVVQSSAWGMSTITVHAENAYGRAADHVQSYLRSPDFLPVADPLAAIAQGVYARLNQPVLDDNLPDLDDVASIIAAAMTPAEVYAMIPTVMWTGDVLEGKVLLCTDQLTVTKRGLSWQSPQVDLQPSAASGLGFGGIISQPVLALRVSYTGCLGNTTVVNGTLSASSLTLSGTSQVSLTGSHASATVNLSMNTVSPDIDLSGSFIAEVTTLISAVVLPFVANTLEDAAAQALEDEAGPIIEDFFNGFGLEESTSVNGADVTATADLDLVAVGYGFVELALEARLDGTIPATGPAPAFGPLVAEPTSPPAFSTHAYEGGIAMKLDVINELLWVVWQGGGFDVADLEGLPGGAVAGLAGSAATLLPPVILPGTGSAAFDLAIGDVAVSAMVDPATYGLPGATSGAPVPVEAYGSARLGVQLAYDDATHRLDVTAITPEIEVQVVGAEDLLDEVAIAAAVEAALTALFATRVPEVIRAIPQPALDISASTGVAGSELLLEGVTVGRDGSYLTMTGAVVAN